VEERLVDLESGGNDPHNVYVQIFFEMGIFGLVTFVWLIASLFIKLRKQYSFDKGGFIIMTALLASYLIACSSDNMLDYLAFQWYFWFFMDIVCAWNRLETAISRRSAGADRWTPGALTPGSIETPR